MLKNEDIIRLAEREEDYVIQCRRTVHRFAEVSGKKVKTSAYVREEAAKLGLETESVSATGLVVTLDTGREGPHIALRADIDALPMHEEPTNLKGERTCRSENPDTCHACGHDAHTAMLLGAMKILAERKDELCGVIYLCFEEGEENGGGIEGMLKALDQRSIDAVWAIHVYAGLESGKICVSPGPRMSGAAAIDIRVKGRGGHASRPDLCLNPVFCAANMVMNLGSIWTNRITSGETVTLGISRIDGGTTGNIIPDEARLMGSMRFFNMDEGYKAVELLKKVAADTADMYGCEAEPMPRCRVLVGPVVNDLKLGAMMEKELSELLPEGSVSPCDPWYASESFSKYCSSWPAIMAHLGIKNEVYGSGAAHHNGYFDVDEGVLKLGVEATLKFAAAVMEEYKRK